MKHSDTKQLNEHLSSLSSEDVLVYCSEVFGNRIAFATSLGLEDQVITHMIAKQNLNIRIFTLDTGRIFPETYDLIERTNARYKINIEIVFPESGEVENMVNQHGINLFYTSIEHRKQCCYVRKTKPLLKALSGLDAWITGLRKEQSVTRTGIETAGWDSINNLIKINPLIEWSEAEVKAFIMKNNVPYNPLHDKGFPSIGCQPCTRAVLPGDDIRSGRWWWEHPEQKECGLHK
jgi:phosphoadenosine phosphosulfate reductase